MGKLHFMNMLHMKDIKVVAVADIKRSNLRIARRFNLHIYDNYRSLIDHENLDAVIISLPNFLREESIIYATEKKLDIFVDKPLARGLDEAKRIVRKVEKAGIRLMTGVNYRYINSVQKLKTLLDEGRIGDVVIATSDLIMNGPFTHPLVPKPVSEWWLNKEMAGGGALQDLGYHLIDIFNWMFGELEVTYSSLGYRFNLPIEDSAVLILRSKKTSTNCNINVGWFSKMTFPDFNFRVNLHGTVGYVSTDDYAPRNLYFHAAKEAFCNCLRKIFKMNINYLSYTYYYSSFFKVLDLFFESIKKDATPPVSLDEQLEVIRIIEKVYRATRVA